MIESQSSTYPSAGKPQKDGELDAISSKTSSKWTTTTTPATMRIKKKICSPSSSSKGSLRPPRPPITAGTVVDEFSSTPDSPVHQHLQVETSEDLSSADFSNIGADSGEGYNFFVGPELSPRHPASLSGFLEDNDKKSCFGTNIFRRRGKISSIDVASVGNASDTAVSVTSSHYTSGREIHEKAKLYFNAGKFAEALAMFESILSAQVRRFTPLHPSVGAAMHNVGVCRQRLGQHALAENLFEEAVQIRRKTLGSNHFEVAASLSKLGASQTALQKFDEAYCSLRTALHISRQNLGNEHKTVAQMLCHLACLYFEAGEMMSAQATFEDALDIYRRVWPRETDRDSCMTQLTDTLCNIGSIQNRRKKFNDAIESFSEALDLQRGLVGHDHSRVISTLDNLGYAYSKSKEYAIALSCYRKMLRAQISHHGIFNAACFETLRKEILMYEKLRRFSEATEELKEMLQHQMSMSPLEKKLIAETKALLEELKRKARSRDNRPLI